jgi:Family of unknown function (DUF6524)
MAEISTFTPQRFLVHWVSCQALVLATYNPFGHSYYDWVMGPADDPVTKLLVGLMLAGTYVFLIWVIAGSLGRWGLVAGALLLALSINQLLEHLPTSEPRLRQSAVLFCIGSLLSVGLSWPHFWSSFSGIINKRWIIPKKRYRRTWSWWYW